MIAREANPIEDLLLRNDSVYSTSAARR